MKTTFRRIFQSLIVGCTFALCPPAFAINLGNIVTVAGGGAGGDGSAATAASLSGPYGVTVDSSGNFYIADRFSQRIRKVTAATGIITAVAGNGIATFSGDGGAATAASLYDPLGVTVDSSGNLYIVDNQNNRIRKVTAATGIITTVAGNGTAAFSGDGAAATAASLKSPYCVSVDSNGNLYIADSGNQRIRKVTAATGIITTVAGNGTATFAGDGANATSAGLLNPYGVTVDSNGNLYIADYGNSRVRKVTAATGIITTVAGNGTAAFSGDGAAATAASLKGPLNVTVGSSGDLYIADLTDNRIRKVTSATGIITTVAGNGSGGYSGDGVAATSTSLYNPRIVSFDSSGNMYIADTLNSRIRKVYLDAVPTVTLTSTPLNFSNQASGAIAFSANETATFQCKVDSGTFATCTSPFSYNNLANGQHTVTIKATDTAGNESTPAIISWTVDALPPTVTLTSTLTGLTKQTTTILTYSANETATFAITRNGTPVTVASGGTLTLVEGRNTITATATDLAGNIGTATVIIDVDTMVQPPTINTLPITWTQTSYTVTGQMEIGSTITLTSSGSANVGTITYPTTSTWSAVISNLSDGSYTLTARATDAIGNVSANQSASIIVDATGPTLTITTLNNGAYTNSATLNVTGTATAPSGIKTVTVNNTPVAVTNGAFTALLTLTEGSNEVSVIATDNGDNTTTNTRTINYDKTAPTLTVTAPADNSVTSVSSIDVTGTIDENSIVSMTVNGGSAQLAEITNVTNYKATVNLDSGTNSINITATDLANNSSSATRTIISGTVNPELSITSPPQGQVIRNGNVTIIGTASAASDVTVTVNANGTDYTPAVTNGSFSQPLTFTEEKLYPVTVTATDQANHTTTVIRNILYSKGQISILGNPSYTNSTAVTLDLGYYPAAPHTATHMQFLYNNKAWTLPVIFTQTKQIILPAGDGTKDIIVRFLDEAGTPSGDYSTSVILDTIAPIGGINVESGAAQTRNTTLHLDMFATDINGVTKMQLSEDGITWGSEITFRTSYDYPLISTINGTKRIYVKFKDASGKWSPVYSDTIVLNSALIAPPVANGNITIKSAKLTDPIGYTTATGIIATVSSIDSYMSFSTNGTTWSAWELTKPTKLLTLPSGAGTKTVYARFAPVVNPAADQINSTIYSGSIILDIKAPVGKVLINGGARVTNDRSVELTLEASDMNGVVGMYITYDLTIPAVFEQYSNTKTVTLPAVDGTKRVSVVYVDAAGKLSKACSDTIILDTTAPIGTVKATLITGAVSPNPNVALTIASSGSVAMQISLDNGTTWGNWEPYATSKKIRLSIGVQYYVKLKFRDLAGNVSVPTVAAVITTVPSTTSLTGKLYDSISGVRYSTATQSGYTDAQGNFKYVEGETVTFKIGNFVLGQVKGAQIIIPPALQDANGLLVDPALSLRLLQTLDSDNDPSNGITITVDTYPGGHLANITTETAAQTFLNSLKIKKTLVTEASALAHFTNSLDNIPDSGVTPPVAVAPLAYTKLRAVTTTRVVNINNNLSEPDPKCNVDNITVKRSSATWTPENVTVRINQSDYLLPGPGNVFKFENDLVAIRFIQPELASSQDYGYTPGSVVGLVGWRPQQHFDPGMGVVRYFDKVAGCAYNVLVKDESWYALKNNLTPRSELFRGAIGLTDGCPDTRSISTNGTGVWSCLIPGDKWFSYESGVFDPDGYVARLDWKVDLDGAAWINGSCQSGAVVKGEIVRTEGKVNWICDDHNQVNFYVHLNWLNPTIAEGYPEHKITLTPYDDKLQKGAEAILTVAGKPLAIPTTYTISGTITTGGTALAGVSVSTAGGTATTDSSGNYTITGVANDSYTVTPSKSGYTFSPGSASVTVSGANVTGKNFTATVATYSPTGANFKMPDTNQTTSYTTTFGEDHDYSINPPSYTDNGNGTITDNVTSLVWQKQDDGIKRASANSLTYCDNLTLGGQSDWRLPSRIELISIIDNGVSSPAINSSYFPATVSAYYSTSTPNPLGSVWIVGFGSGYAALAHPETLSNVRCVRGGQ